jgi:hypothetical protein
LSGLRDESTETSHFEERFAPPKTIDAPCPGLSYAMVAGGQKSKQRTLALSK